MAKVAVLTETLGHAGDEHWGDTGGCTAQSLPRPAEASYVTSLRTRLLLRRNVTAPATDQLNHWDTSTHFCGIWCNEAASLPKLGTIASQSRIRSQSTGFRRRVRKGEIVTNPMRTSSLVFTDEYVIAPGASQSRQQVSFSSASERSEGYYSVKCNRQLFVDRFGVKRAASYAPSGSLWDMNFATLQCWYTVTDSKSLLTKSSELGITQHTVDALLRQLDAHIASQQRDSGLMTAVVGDTRSGTYDLLTDIAEAKSTVELIFSCVLRILQEYSNVKKRIASRPTLDPRRRKSIWDEASQEWLQFRYGITPLVSSINSALEWWQKRDYEFAKFRKTKSSELGTLDLGEFKFTLPPLVDRTFGKVRVSGATRGLKLNPLTTALELVPLSFLLNWVCNIGDYLSALWPPEGADQEVYTYSRSLTKADVSASFGATKVNFTYGFYDLKTFDPLDNLAIQLEWNVTWKRMLDAFALVYVPLRSSIYH